MASGKDELIFGANAREVDCENHIFVWERVPTIERSHAGGELSGKSSVLSDQILKLVALVGSFAIALVVFDIWKELGRSRL